MTHPNPNKAKRIRITRPAPRAPLTPAEQREQERFVREQEDAADRRPTEWTKKVPYAR